MVKIPLTIEQINNLLAWRDQHKELVRALVVPFDDCCILCENGIKVSVKRKYTPCESAFSVRGHYRHYKSGKVVYVHPYEKNAGKEKDKRNKVLKIGEI